jgi:hypothetical protein
MGPSRCCDLLKRDEPVARLINANDGRVINVYAKDKRGFTSLEACESLGSKSAELMELPPPDGRKIIFDPERQVAGVFRNADANSIQAEKEIRGPVLILEKSEKIM